MSRRVPIVAITLAIVMAGSGVASAPSASPPRAPRAPVALQHGVAFPVWWHNLYATPEADRAIAAAAEMGINSIQLIATWYLDTSLATTVYPDAQRTPSDASLAHAAATARRLGLRVMLKLHVDVQDGTWRGELAPSDRRAWFDSYARMVRKYAGFARDRELSALIIGTELRTLTTTRDTDAWRELIADVRAAYPGQVSYAANWDEYEAVRFWDALDFIGIDAYFPLVDAAVTPDPAFSQILLAWRGYAGRHGRGAWIEELDRFAAAAGRPVVFTEVGYRSQDGAADTPWLADNGLPPNLDLQRRLYEAVYRLYVPRSYFRGLFWWRWDLEPATRAPTITPRGKSAEAVLRSWSQRLGGAPVSSTGR